MTIDELLVTEIPCPGARSGVIAVKDATAADLLTATRLWEERTGHRPDDELYPNEVEVFIVLLKKLRSKMNRYGAHSVSDLPVRWIAAVLSQN